MLRRRIASTWFANVRSPLIGVHEAQHRGRRCGQGIGSPQELGEVLVGIAVHEDVVDRWMDTGLFQRPKRPPRHSSDARRIREIADELEMHRVRFGLRRRIQGSRDEIVEPAHCFVEVTRRPRQLVRGGDAVLVVGGAEERADCVGDTLQRRMSGPACEKRPHARSKMLCAAPQVTQVEKLLASVWA